MKYLKSFTEVNELAKYTDSDMRKDARRIDDMVKKADGDKEMLLKLATTMANRITNYDKAYYRAMAAEDENYKDVAKIFFDRAETLK